MSHRVLLCGQAPRTPAVLWRLFRICHCSEARCQPGFQRSPLHSRSRFPMKCLPIKDSASQRAERNHECQAFVGRQAEGDVEWHPVPDQIQTVDQVGVPAQFPALATSSAGTGSGACCSAFAIAAMPASPRRPIIASICGSLAGDRHWHIVDRSDRASDQRHAKPRLILRQCGPAALNSRSLSSAVNLRIINCRPPSSVDGLRDSRAAMIDVDRGHQMRRLRTAKNSSFCFTLLSPFQIPALLRRKTTLSYW